MRKSLLTTILAGFVATAAAASDEHSNHSGHDHGMMKDGIQAEVTINAMSDGTVNVTHGPIPEINWPAMTMDLNLLDGAEVGDVSVGGEAMMMLEKGEDGMFAIRALMPME